MSIDYGGQDPNLQVTDFILTGSVMPYAGTGSAPKGFLLCDGSSYSTGQYSFLFSVIGYTYGGSGDSFNVPDLRGRTPCGLDNLGGSSANRITDAQADTLGGSMGEELHAMVEAELDNHNHTMNNVPHAGGGSTWKSDTPLALGYLSNTGNTGSNTGFNVVQPTMFLPWIIKT